jgi:uncharacterized protein YdeI (YjbR/CyaY-like superfamily)
MASIKPDPKKIKPFATQAKFEQWLSKHHDREREIWIKVHKKASGLPSITTAQALEVALCWGWIDGIRKGLDEQSFLQRYVPRGPKSTWSQINRDHVARLVADGRMTPHGQRHVDAAKQDGRWHAAYAPMRTMTVDAIPKDLRAAIEGSPKANKMFHTLNRENLFALAFRMSTMKTAKGRASKIASLVKMLESGETIKPQSKRVSAKKKHVAR